MFRYTVTCISILFLAYGTRGQDTVTIRGMLSLDSIWAPKLYVSKIRDLNDMYRSAEHLIIAQTEVKQLGDFEVVITPDRPGIQLIRLHVSEKGDPPATLIIDGARENHGFYAISPGENLVLDSNSRNSRLFNHFHSNGYTNRQLAHLDAWIKTRETEQVLLDIPSRELKTRKMIEHLYQYSDTASNVLPALFALVKADHGFNRKIILDKIVELEKRFGSHPYLNPYLPQNFNSTDRWSLVGMTFLLIFTGILGFWWFKRQGVRNKIYQLSPQERKVASLLIEGKSNKEIAHELHVEVSTVKSHIYKLFNKLEIRSRNEVMQYKSYLG